MTEPSPGPTPGECSVEYDGTFAAIQDVVFERHGCTAAACHGSAISGGLDLRPDAAYASLIEAPSSGSALARVARGDDDGSYLYRKLAAKTVPGSFDIGGSPMPIGATTLGEQELALVRAWIKGGAPEKGSVLEAEGLVDGCRPRARADHHPAARRRRRRARACSSRCRPTLYPPATSARCASPSTTT